MKTRSRSLFRIALLVLAASFVLDRTSANSVTPARAATTPDVARTAVSAKLILPVEGISKGELRDTWGAARGSRKHTAIDILAERGKPALAAVDGTILKLFSSKAGGLTIYLADRDRKTLYYYAHLDRYADGVRDGLAVKQGDVIGYVGTTGNAPPGTPHLHFGIEALPPSGEWWKGQPTNPYPILMRDAQ